MAGSTPQPLTRRQFLGACGAATATAVASTPVAGGESPLGQPGSEQTSLQSPSSQVIEAEEDLGSPGSISPQGQKAIAAVDRVLQRQLAQMGKSVNAVKDLGLDPQGNTPIDAALEEAMDGMSNTRITFPSDTTFRLKSGLTPNPSGPIEIAGNGTTFRCDENMKEYALNFPGLPSGTLITGITIDQSAKGARSGIRMETDGSIELRDMAVKGYGTPTEDSNDGVNVIVPVARNPNSTVRITNFQAIGGTGAGLHDDPDKPASDPANRLGAPLGLWVGQSSQGTVQMVNPRIRGWSNGTYSGRTDARVEIHGGVLWNNYNCQARISGNSIVDGTTMILDGRQWDMEKNPGPYSLGVEQGVNAIRIDPGGSKGDQSHPVSLRNIEIKAKYMEKSSALIDFEGSAGPGKIQNCRITTHMDVPVILGEKPGSQFNYGAAPQTNIEMSNCIVQGQSSEPVMEIEGRPDSRIQQTCITLPNAGPNDIQGAIVGNGVSFGQCTAQSVLSAPRKIGSNANVSSLPAPNVSFNGSSLGASVNTGPSRQEYKQQQKNWALKWIYRLVAVAAMFGIVIVLGFLIVSELLSD